MNFDDEQLEVIKVVNTMLDDDHSGYGWGHFQGDVVPRILAHYIKRHLPSKHNIVGPNVYIEDIPTEFDLMVVDADSEPITFTSAYRGEQVRCILEVKRKGIFGNTDTFPKAVERINTNFDNALHPWRMREDRLGFSKERRTNCKAAYITISETVRPKRESSTNYGNITRGLLEPYPVFVLQDSRSREIQRGEWQRFIEFVTSDEYPVS